MAGKILNEKKQPMKIIDLTHCINEATMVWPGTAQPVIRPSSTLAADGFRETRLDIPSHLGTHMDSPAHMEPALRTLDTYPVDTFCGRAWTIDCSAAGPGGFISRTMLLSVTEPEAFDFILLYTGWEQHWGTASYFGPYPVLTPDAADYLANLPIKGIGIDTMGVDSMDSETFAIHHILFQKDKVILENLNNLHSLIGHSITLTALPLYFEQADGAPIRAIAAVPS